MKSSLKDGLLIIYTDEKIDSSNADAVDSEIGRIIAQNKFESFHLDLSNTRYVSSAGLRVVLKLAKLFSDFKVINVSVEVYDVFEMTGFSSIIKIEKAMRMVSLEGAELIGDGFCSKVYRLNKDTIIKVITNTTDINDISRELNLCKQAFILGIPTSISFDVVKVEDRYGVIFEMLDCSSLRDLILKNPDKIDEYIIMYADLLKKINSTDKADFKIPSAKEIVRRNIEKIKEGIDQKDYEKVIELFETIPDANTLVHGDCHIKNIMVENNEPNLIDMDTLCYGDPIFELAPMGATYLAFEKTEKGNTLSFLKLTAECCEKIFYDTMRLYFKNLSDEEYKENIEKILTLTYVHMLCWTINAQADNNTRFSICYDELKKYLATTKDLVLKY